MESNSRHTNFASLYHTYVQRSLDHHVNTSMVSCVCHPWGWVHCHMLNIYIYIYCYQSIVFSYVCLRNRHTSFYLSTTVMSTYRTYDIYIYNVHFICFLLNTILCNMNRLSYLVNKCVTLSIWCVNYTIQRVFLHYYRLIFSAVGDIMPTLQKYGS